MTIVENNNVWNIKVEMGESFTYKKKQVVR
jgi:hypothetical protein